MHIQYVQMGGDQDKLDGMCQSAALGTPWNTYLKQEVKTVE